MALRFDLDSYKDRYDNIRLDRDENGVLEVTFHTNGDSMVWTREVPHEIADAWLSISQDLGNRVVIVTGAGDTFLDLDDYAHGDEWTKTEAQLDTWLTARRLIHNQIDVEVPMIAAVNGSARIHSEQAFLCDIVLSSEDAMFADAPHFLIGAPPGDGIQTIYTWAFGYNRGRAILLTGDQFTAAQAKEWGGVYEVHPKGEVLNRAREIASTIARKPDIALRMSRTLLTAPLKKAMIDSLGAGLPSNRFSHTAGHFEPGLGHALGNMNPYGRAERQ